MLHERIRYFTETRISIHRTSSACQIRSLSYFTMDWISSLQGGKCGCPMPLTEAVTQAVNDCIKENILADFLKKNKAEVVSMSLFEYDEKKHEQTMIEIGREEGDIRRLSLQIIKKILKNKSLAQIADELEEDPETIQPLYNVVLQHAPDFDMDEITKDVSTMQK